TDSCQAASEAFMTSQFTRRWKLILAPAITLALILPVPGYAAYTLGTWLPATSGGGFLWNTNSSSGYDLVINPVLGSVTSAPVDVNFTAPVTYSSGTATANVSNTGQNFSAIPGINNGLGTAGATTVTVTIGFGDGTTFSQIITSYTQSTGSN